MKSVTLIGKPGCHLCDDARVIVREVCEQRQVPWEEKSVLDDPVLMDKYADHIPVVLIDDVQHSMWFVDRDAFVLALDS